MSNTRLSGIPVQVRNQSIGQVRAWQLLLAAIATLAAAPAIAGMSCERTLKADVVAFDQPLMYNRLGAANINGMMFALRRDAVFVDRGNTGDSDHLKPLTKTSKYNSQLVGNVELRPDKRPRPLVLRIPKGDCLEVKLTNLLDPLPNPNKQPRPRPATPPFYCAQDVNGNEHCIDEQTAGRRVGFHVNGMQLVNDINDDASFVGKNSDNAMPAPGETRTYTLYGEREGVFLAHSYGAVTGSDANQGASSNGLFGQVIVEPADAKIYRSILTEEEMRLATKDRTPSGHPIIDYEKTYPTGGVWDEEGKGGLPVLNMIQGDQIVHAEIEAMIVGPNADGSFPRSTYPLEKAGYRNPTVPNRLEAFRDFAQVWHDEPATQQAFPGFYNDPVFGYVLAGVKDGFMINFGSGGIGSEIIANRLGVGPMHDCLTCAYEEFFLTSYTVGDPALLVDIPANFGLENCRPDLTGCEAVGPKASKALYPNDPINVHHSYIGDFVKFRNTHIGKEQHVFHLHNHQWLYNPNDDNANYLDAQGVGPGVGYTYEINFGGSGNRNKSAGDAIFHCHFYPHFAQGMWYHWRNYDVMEEGTRLLVSGAGFHTERWALQDGTPAAGARALPDGEITVGVPLVAIVPLPGKGMAPMPAEVTVKANPITTATGRSVGSVAEINRNDCGPGRACMLGPDGIPGTEDDKNPGYPFWVAGIEDIVGQRPPTPVLDMLDPATAAAIKTDRICVNDSTGKKTLRRGDCQAGETADSSPYGLWSGIVPDQADGHDGGLPRAALQGYAAGGATEHNVVSPRDFTKVIAKAKPVYFPEEGTDAEKVAMKFHSKRLHDTVKMVNGSAVDAKFATNGAPPAVGAPYHEPCIDDTGQRLGNGVLGHFFSGENGSWTASVGALLAEPGYGDVGMKTRGQSYFTADNPRRYKGANMQFDAILNKVGYHYPQQRIIALWEDVEPVINKQQPAEPLVMRLNTFDCAVYSHSNLVPEYYEMDDYQVRTPTDIIGQHIHLPKWDLTTTDGAANGWNYEDGTLSPGAIRERIHAVNEWNIEQACDGHATVAPPAGATMESHVCAAGTLAGQTVQVPMLHAKAHPFFPATGPGGADWMGARTTMQRWFADPVVNTDGVDRGLGIIFTHDHYGPSTHQQIGLYATVLTEPAGSKWVHNEKGTQLGASPVDGKGGRMDGGPTSWQAAILTPDSEVNGNTTQSHTVGAFREFYFEFSDFQHAYEKDKYVGADRFGVPIPPVGAVIEPANRAFDLNLAGLFFTENPRVNRVQGTDITNSFRYAINPPARFQINPVYPDLVVEAADCVKDEGTEAVLLTRPCPQAIDVEDPGMFVVNYRNEPIALRVFDPRKTGPDGKKGAQTDGVAGDLAFALASKVVNKDGSTLAILRAIDELNQTESQLMPWGANALNAPSAVEGGDPFTPMLRTYAGDTIRVKIQAGAHEEEHNASIGGLKWLQGGSGHGKQPNSGWRNSQAAGISEQFTLVMPINKPNSAATGGGVINSRDYVYNIDSSQDGWWSGTWGLVRSYEAKRGDLFALPNNQDVKPDRVMNKAEFDGVCPLKTPTGATTQMRNLSVVAILANDLLPNSGVDINPKGVSATDLAKQHNGAPLKDNGTLVYNPRETSVSGHGADGNPLSHTGPIHDPTAMLFVHLADLEPDPTKGGVAGRGACRDGRSMPGVANAECPVRLISDAYGKPIKKVEPLIVRAKAGECVDVTVYNRMPDVAPDLPTFANLIGANKRDRDRPEGSIPFDNNLIRPSTHVGLSPQLVTLDVTSDLGVNVGANVMQTVPPASLVNGKPKTQIGKFRWYMGDVAHVPVTGGVELVATPVEFGGFGLSPADKVKQGQKSLVGGMVVLPGGSEVTGGPDVTFSEDANQRAQATVTIGKGKYAKQYRDFMLVMTKNLNHRYKDGSSVEHMNGEGVGIPEDSQESSAMALNYGIEPLWYRFGILPQAAFGGAGCGGEPGCYGGVPDPDLAYSNSLVGGDPATPVFAVKPGTEARIHSAVPHGTSRGTTLTFHGHVWQRDPYVCENESRNGLPGACGMSGVGSRSIGDNPYGFAQGAQESITPYSHFTFRFPSAGGAGKVEGDYLFRDIGSFGNASGLWGILRVDPYAPQ